MRGGLSKLLKSILLVTLVFFINTTPILAATLTINLAQNTSSTNTSYSSGSLKLSTEQSSFSNSDSYTLSEFILDSEYEDYSLMAFDETSNLLYLGGVHEIVVLDTHDNSDPSDDSLYGRYDSTDHAIFSSAQFRTSAAGYSYGLTFFTDPSNGYMYIPAVTSHLIVVDTQLTKTLDDDVVVGSYNLPAFSSGVQKYGTKIFFRYNSIFYIETQGTDAIGDDTFQDLNNYCSWVCLIGGVPFIYDEVNNYIIAGKQTTYPNTTPYYGGVQVVALNSLTDVSDDVYIRNYATPGYEATGYSVNDFYWDDVNDKFYFSSQYGLVVYDTQGTLDYLDDTHEFTYDSATFPELTGNLMRNFEIDVANNRILIDNAIINTNGTVTQADDYIEKVFDNNYFLDIFSDIDGDISDGIDLISVFYDVDNDIAYMGFNIYGNVYYATVSLDGYLPSTEYEIDLSDFAGGTWDNMASMDLARVGSAYGVIDDKFYVASGTKLWDDTETSEVYDPITDSWSYIASMPISLVAPASAVYNGKLYVVGGRDNAYDVQSGLYAYDPGADSWETLAPMPTARNSPSGSVLDGKWYVVGGLDTNGYLIDTLEIYDFATDSWTTASSAPIAIGNGHVFQAVNGKLYLMGGYFGIDSDPNYTVAEYNPDTDTWDTGLTSIPIARSGLASLVYHDNVIVFGGTDYDIDTVNSVFAYNVTNDIWFKIPPLPAFRHRVSVGIIGDYLYIAGGKSETWTGANNVYRISVADYLNSLRNWDIDTFQWNRTLPANTTLTISVSTNGGANYTTIPSTGTYTIPDTDPRLFKVKFLFTSTDRAVTSTVSNSEILYSKYKNTGEYISKVIGSPTKVKWGTFSKSDTISVGTSATYSVRFGDTSSPDGTWTAWLNTSQVANKEYKYAQVKTTLSTTDLSITPSVSAMSLTYTDIPVSDPEPEEDPTPTPTPTPVVPSEEEPVDEEEEEIPPIDEEEENEEPESPSKEESHVVVIYGPDGDVLANTTVRIGDDVYRTDNKGRLYLGSKPVKKTKVEVLVNGKWVGSVLGEDDTRIIITEDDIKAASGDGGLNSLIWVGVGGFAVISLILFWFYKRKRKEEDV